MASMNRLNATVIEIDDFLALFEDDASVFLFSWQDMRSTAIHARAKMKSNNAHVKLEIDVNEFYIRRAATALSGINALYPNVRGAPKFLGFYALSRDSIKAKAASLAKTDEIDISKPIALADLLCMHCGYGQFGLRVLCTSSELAESPVHFMLTNQTAKKNNEVSVIGDIYKTYLFMNQILEMNEYGVHNNALMVCAANPDEIVRNKHATFSTINNTECSMQVTISSCSAAFDLLCMQNFRHTQFALLPYANTMSSEKKDFDDLLNILSSVLYRNGSFLVLVEKIRRLADRQQILQQVNELLQKAFMGGLKNPHSVKSGAKKRNK